MNKIIHYYCLHHEMWTITHFSTLLVNVHFYQRCLIDFINVRIFFTHGKIYIYYSNIDFQLNIKNVHE